MSDECDCPCPGQPEQPLRTSDGKALDSSDGGTQTIALAGAVGRNGQGDPALRHVGVDKKTGGLLVKFVGNPRVQYVVKAGDTIVYDPAFITIVPGTGS